MIARALRRRPGAGAEQGFTLVELLLAMTLGLIILGSATMITIGAARHNNEVADRVDATQRGRLALDRIQRELRSQVCVTAATSKYPIAAASGQSIAFYSDLSDGSRPVQKHTITYDPAARAITDATVEADAGGAFTAPARTEVLATNVDAPADGAVFRYWSYPTVATAGQALEPSVPLAAPVSGANLGLISRIDIGFLTTGTSTATRAIRADMSDQVFVRLARPNDATNPSPNYNLTCEE